MEQRRLTVERIVAVLAATALALTLLNAGPEAPAWIAAAVIMLATGLLVNRFWAAAVPFALMAALAAFVLLAYVGEPGDDVITGGEMALWVIALVAGLPLCLLIGVGLRRLARRGDKGTRAA
ncbi:MAG TPA: hypothetical protein VGW75_07425 [Solirubrobacteraceae bacterium]|jgi:hypothetical protein|nr:hypothetical protein [Solirubrobacteraceae bacterium]